MKPNFRTLLLCAAFFLLPFLSEACPMCQGGTSKDTIFAYKGITLFLALLPVLGGGGIFYWIYLRSKKAESEQNKGD